MTRRGDLSDVVARCAAGERDDVLAEAVVAGDVLTMLVVAVFDVPVVERLWLLLEQSGGPEIASAIVVKGVVHDCPVTEFAFEAIEERGDQLSLDEDQADFVLERLASTEHSVDVQLAGIVLRWVATHQRQAALVFSSACLNEAPVASPDAVQREALSLLGNSPEATHRGALLDLAGSCYEAGEPQHAGEILGYLRAPTDTEVTRLISYFGLHGASNWGLSPGHLNVLSDLGIEQLRSLGAAVPDRIPEAWFNSHLLPALFARHASSLIDTLTDDWWTPSSLGWVAQEAPWDADDHELLLPVVLRGFRERKDDRLQQVVRTKLRERALVGPPDIGARSAFPWIGAQTLLGEALSGRIPTGDPDLAQVLAHLRPIVRQLLYVDANWRTSARAARLGEVIAAVDVTDAASDSVAAAGFDLPAKSRDAWLRAVSPELDEDTATTLIARAGDNVDALTALASGDAAADLLLEWWRSQHDLTAFNALAGSVHDLTRLQAIPEAVRTYPGRLSTPKRRDLLARYATEHDRRPVLEGLLEDRNTPRAASRPSRDLLIVALKQLGEDLSDEDPENTLEVLAAICSSHRDVAVRTAAYETVARCRPTGSVVDLLLRRRSEERAASDAATAAIRAVGQALDQWAADSIGEEHIEVLQRLTLIDPNAAVPYARAILDTDTDSPAQRSLAAGILGQHGDDEDIARLETARSQEPDPATERALAMAIRRRKVGDLAAAHQRLGELAGLDEQTWHSQDENLVWANRGPALVEALDRIAKHQTNQDHGSAIDQLSEVARVVLFRAIDIATDELALGAANREKVRANAVEFGEVLGWFQKNDSWPETVSLAALHDLRTEHVTPKGSHTPHPQRGPDDYEKAEWLFQRGMFSIVTKRLMPYLVDR